MKTISIVFEVVYSRFDSYVKTCIFFNERKERFEHLSRECIEFISEFISKFGKFKKLEPYEILFELDDKKEQLLYSILKAFGGRKRKIYNKLIKDLKSNNFDIERIEKEIIKELI